MVKFEIALNQDGLLPSWSKPDVAKHGLYVFLSSSEIIRVGETSSGCARIVKGFREPLRKMLRGKERKNYLAYSWRKKHAEKSINVNFFNLPEEPFADSYLRRSLEAEVTFQLRVQMKHWPREMSEIHFLESSRTHPDVVAQASRILSEYGYCYRHDI